MALYGTILGPRLLALGAEPETPLPGMQMTVAFASVIRRARTSRAGTGPDEDDRPRTAPLREACPGRGHPERSHSARTPALCQRAWPKQIGRHQPSAGAPRSR